MSDYLPPVPYQSPPRYSSNTPAAIPVLVRFVRGGVILGLEWTTLDFIEHAPTLVKIGTFGLAILMLAVLESRDWLHFKGRYHFISCLLAVLAIWAGVVAYGYLGQQSRATQIVQSSLTRIERAADILPTSAEGLNPGTVWNDDGKFAVVPTPPEKPLAAASESTAPIRQKPQSGASAQLQPSSKPEFAAPIAALQSATSNLPYLTKTQKEMIAALCDEIGAKVKAFSEGITKSTDMALAGLPVGSGIMGYTSPPAIQRIYKPLQDENSALDDMETFLQGEEKSVQPDSIVAGLFANALHHQEFGQASYKLRASLENQLPRGSPLRVPWTRIRMDFNRRIARLFRQSVKLTQQVFL